MAEFKKYKRSAIAEMKEVTETDIQNFKEVGSLIFDGVEVSISKEDLKNGSPKLGDYIARNPDNNYDKWLVAGDYFKKNFEELL